MTTWTPVSTFASRLRHLRYALDLTVDEISEKCGIASATWSTWENEKKPRNMADAVAKITRATEVDPMWLMWGGGEWVARDSNPEPTGSGCPGQLELVA